MKKIILSLLLVVTTCSFAQSSFKGTLVSPDQKPISAANVILMSLPDSILVKGAISNQRGVFELPNAAEGKKVVIKITHLEYQTVVFTEGYAHQYQCGAIDLAEPTQSRNAYQLLAWGEHFLHRWRL